MSRFGYDFYLFDERMPITPGSLQTTVPGQNETMNLINDGEINFLKLPGLTNVSFELRLPHRNTIKSASYMSGFKDPKHYLGLLQRAKTECATTDFIVSRGGLVNGEWYGTEMKVSVEDFTVDEDASTSSFVVVSVSLKLYKDFSTKKLTMQGGAAKVESERPAGNKPTSYTAQPGETMTHVEKKLGGVSKNGGGAKLGNNPATDVGGLTFTGGGTRVSPSGGLNGGGGGKF